MKKAMLIVAMCSGLSYAQAQKLKDADVPTAVKDSFMKQYPSTKAGWEKEGANYEAEFEINKVETSVVYDATGKLLETESEIAESILPEGVKEYVAKNMSGKKIKESAKIVDANNKVTYEVEIDKIDYLFDEAGTLIKKH